MGNELRMLHTRQWNRKSRGLCEYGQKQRRVPKSLGIQRGPKTPRISLVQTSESGVDQEHTVHEEVVQDEIPGQGGVYEFPLSLDVMLELDNVLMHDEQLQNQLVRRGFLFRLNYMV